MFCSVIFELSPFNSDFRKVEMIKNAVHNMKNVNCDDEKKHK